MLSAKRARGAQHIRENSDRKRHCLEGIIPIIEDWHAKMCLVGVSHCYSGVLLTQTRGDWANLFLLKGICVKQSQ